MYVCNPILFATTTIFCAPVLSTLSWKLFHQFLLVDNWDSSINSFHTRQATLSENALPKAAQKKMDVETKNYWEEGIKIRVFAFSFSMNYLW